MITTIGSLSRGTWCGTGWRRSLATSSSREGRAVEQLLEWGEAINQQDCKVPILNKRLMRVHKDAKDPLDLESTSKL